MKKQQAIKTQRKPIKETTIMSEKGPVKLSLFRHCGENVIMYSAPNMTGDELMKFKKDNAKEITKFKLSNV